jgi:preprotein translocase subunit SecD
MTRLFALLLSALLLAAPALAEDTTPAGEFRVGADRMPLDRSTVEAAELIEDRDRPCAEDNVIIEIRLNDRASTAFERLTRDHVGDVAHIFVGGEEVVAPRIMTAIPGGVVRIICVERPAAQAFVSAIRDARATGD